MRDIGDMFNLQEYRQIFKINYMLVANYDHCHKPEVAHHVETQTE